MSNVAWTENVYLKSGCYTHSPVVGKTVHTVSSVKWGLHILPRECSQISHWYWCKAQHILSSTQCFTSSQPWMSISHMWRSCTYIDQCSMCVDLLNRGWILWYYGSENLHCSLYISSFMPFCPLPPSCGTQIQLHMGSIGTRFLGAIAVSTGELSNYVTQTEALRAGYKTALLKKKQLVTGGFIHVLYSASINLKVYMKIHFATWVKFRISYDCGDSHTDSVLGICSTNVTNQKKSYKINNNLVNIS